MVTKEGLTPGEETVVRSVFEEVGRSTSLNGSKETIDLTLGNKPAYLTRDNSQLPPKVTLEGQPFQIDVLNQIMTEPSRDLFFKKVPSKKSPVK